MYIISLERIPLPQLSTYVCLSFLSFFSSLGYLILDYLYYSGYNVVKTNLSLPNESNKSFLSFSTFKGFLEDSWCFWSCINLAYCALLMVGRMFQDIFFGELRAEESSHVIEKFWNFVFYKLVFIYGILNVKTIHELLLWTGWSSILGFMHLLTNLAKERFEFTIQSAKVSFKSHVKIIALLIIILMCGNFLSFISVLVGVKFSYHIMFFMLAEVFQLTAITIFVLINYGIYFYMKEGRTVEVKSFTQKNKFVQILEKSSLYKGFNQLTAQYYVEYYYAIIAHLVDFMHNLHMLLWNNIKINMTGLVIGMHLQYLYYDLSKRYSRHKVYLMIVDYIERHFPLINKQFENCAICWESLSECRLLPCQHLFHDACLRLWLENSRICPTCKSVLLHLEDTNSSIEYSKSDSEIISERFPNSKTIVKEGLSEFNASLLKGKADYVHSIYPSIPSKIIYHHLIILNGDVEKLIALIQNGVIRDTVTKLFTGPMQVELDACHNHGYVKFEDSRYLLPQSDDGDFDTITNLYDNALDDSSYRKTLLIHRKKEMFSNYTKRYLQQKAI